MRRSMLAAAVVSVGILSGVWAWGQAAPGAPAAPAGGADNAPGAAPAGAPALAPAPLQVAPVEVAPLPPTPRAPAPARATKTAKVGGDAAAPAPAATKQKLTFLGLNTSMPSAALRE
jgi:hypothetical protein